MGNRPGSPRQANRRTVMKINRSGSAVWSGGLKDGKGAISTQSGALDAHPYGFATRFEGVPGSNPEELIAAAHASRSEEHTSELQSLMRISYAVFCLKKKIN